MDTDEQLENDLKIDEAQTIDGSVESRTLGNRSTCRCGGNRRNPLTRWSCVQILFVCEWLQVEALRSLVLEAMTVSMMVCHLVHELTTQQPVSVNGTQKI